MITITTKNGHEHKYRGDITITYYNPLIIISGVWTDPPDKLGMIWSGTIHDGFYPEEIVSIVGSDDDR